MTSQPIWITKSGNLGTIPEQKFYEFTIQASDSEFDDAPILFELIAGEPPQGIHLNGFGTLAGSPLTSLKIVGVPTNVSAATISTFAVRSRVANHFTIDIGDGSSTEFILPITVDYDIYKILVLQDNQPVSAIYTRDDTQTNNITVTLNRAPINGAQLVFGVYSLDSRIADRTFELTVVGESPPDIINPETLIDTVIEGEYVEFQIDVIDLDQDDIEYTIVNGVLPPGVTIDPNTGLIKGYVTLIAFSTASTTPYKSFSFGVLADDGKLQDLQTFEIRVVPSQLMAASSVLITADTELYTADRTTLHSPIIYNDEGEIGPVKHDNFFMYKFNGVDLDNDIIIYEYDLGVGVGYDQVEAPYDNVAYDTTVVGSATEGEFPPGLVLDEDTGWLYGYIPAGSELSVTYLFYVRARKKFVTEPAYPGIDPALYYSERKPFTLTITGQELGTLTWLSDSFLGSLGNGEISEFQIEASIDNGHTVYFELVQGDYNKLPAGLLLLNTGMIVGRASFATFSLDSNATTFDKFHLFVDAETTFDQTYSFSVRAYDLEGTVNTSRVFTILIDRKNLIPYESVFLVGRLPLDERVTLKNLLENRSIIPEADVYRYGDTYFGIQNDLRMLVVNGLTPTLAADYVEVMSKMHFTKQFNFNGIKTAKVLDDDLNTLYEIVYVEIIDTTDTDDGTNVNSSINVVDSNIPDIVTVYPNNINNMRKLLITEFGQVNKELPQWMVDRQDNGRVLGFIKACVLVYTKPGKSDKIAYQLSKLENLDPTHADYFDFKKLTFAVDRYLWDTDLLANYDKNTMTFITAPESTFDIYGGRYDYSVVGNIRVYPFNSNVLIHAPSIGSSGNVYFHGDQVDGHYGSEYVNDPDAIPNANRTTFDANSLRFLAGRDVYSEQDVNDKYLKFPNNNILGT